MSYKTEHVKLTSEAARTDISSFVIRQAHRAHSHTIYKNLNMDIHNEANCAPLEVSYLLSTLHNNISSNADSNGSHGAESEDSLIGNSRRPIVPRQKINARERYRTFK